MSPMLYKAKGPVSQLWLVGGLVAWPDAEILASSRADKRVTGTLIDRIGMQCIHSWTTSFSDGHLKRM